MGGANSGRRRSANRGAVEQYPAIDLRVLRRARLIIAGQCTYTTWHWGNQAPEALNVRIFIDLSDTGDASMRFVRSNDYGAMAERVAIECVPCPYGGLRCYFLCPLVGARCEQLFLVEGIFASRKAHKLTYASQSEDALSRARRKVRKLHRQVEGDFRYARPRGENRWLAVQSFNAAKRKARALYLNRLRALVREIS
jgi:hypothetical protein